MSTPQPLAGRGIVVTRPARQAAALAAEIERQGGHAIVFPTIEIRDVNDSHALETVLGRLSSFDLAVFVSPNAVEKGLAAARARGPLPPRLRIAAVGRGSALELQRLGVDPVIAPRAGDDSESLLELPEFADVAGRRIVVFRGAGGRELIRETLQARGASVEYAECYRRAMPAGDLRVLDTAWERGAIDAFVATSSEGLRNLCAMLEDRQRDRLSHTPVFVTHRRIARTARELGLEKVVVTGTSDAEITASLSRHFACAAA